MNSVRDISLAVTSIAALRAAVAGMPGEVAAARTAPDLWRAFVYDASSTQADDGVYVVKPDSVAPGSPGRWLLKATLESDGPTQAVVIMALAWNGTRAVALMGEGWSVVSCDVSKVYLAKVLDLGGV